MRIRIWICLSWFFVITAALKWSKYKSYPSNEPLINTLDRVLKVSDILVGYYYPRNQTTWYFDKAKYLNNDTVTDWWS